LSDDPRRAPGLARTLGFDGLLFEAASPALDIPALSASGRREFGHLMSAQERQLIGLHWSPGARGFGPGADVDRALHRLEQVLEAAAGLRAPLVCVDVGPLPAPPAEAAPARPAITPDLAGLIILPSKADIAEASSAPAPATRRSNADEAFESQLDGVLMDLGARADRFGVMIAFRSELSSFASLERALKRSGCPWFGVDYDPGAALRDEWSIDEIFSRLAPLIRHVRAREAVRGSGHRTTPATIGAGSVEWGALLASLEAGGYHGWVTIDPTDLPDRSAAAVAGLAHLRGQVAM
jgi:sugar phosphate isomerase/epimerase